MQNDAPDTDIAALPPGGWRKIVRIVSGIGLILVGIVGLILPVMPGWVFIIPGLMIIADYYPPAKRLLEFIKRKFREAREAFPKPEKPASN